MPLNRCEELVWISAFLLCFAAVVFSNRPDEVEKHSKDGGIEGNEKLQTLMAGSS